MVAQRNHDKPKRVEAGMLCPICSRVASGQHLDEVKLDFLGPDILVADALAMQRLDFVEDQRD